MLENENKKVLIVDDSMLTRRFLIEIISTLGYEIETATNGQEALSKLKSQKFDLMLLDLLMPDISGLEVMEALQKEGLQIPTIVVSADVQETTRKKCLELGAIDVVGKPPKQDTLIALIKKSFEV